MLFSDKEVDPSISPFIKRRFDIHFSANTYEQLLDGVKQENIMIEGFKAEYTILGEDSTSYAERLNKLRDVGMRIQGIPNYLQPTRIYSICQYMGIWYFGTLAKHDTSWYKHKDKPHSFSNSLGMELAKSLVCIASEGNKDVSLLDGCCGVGTVMLEGCISDFQIEGCDISSHSTQYAAQNLTHYGYSARVHHCDINELDEQYEAAILDLPYNFYSYSDDAITANIIQSASRLAKKLVIVSLADIENVITQFSMKVTDFCTVEKKGKSKFQRNIWVCQRAELTF